MRFDLALNWEKGLNLLNMDYVPIKEIRRSKRIDEYYHEDLPMKAYVLHPGSELMQHPAHYTVSLDLCMFMDYYTFLRDKRDWRTSLIPFLCFGNYHLLKFTNFPAQSR